MKKILPAVAGLLAIAFMQPASAQTTTPCDIKGILTDPGNTTMAPHKLLEEK